MFSVKPLVLAVAAASMLTLSGCATQGLGSADYKRTEARQVISTITARVVSIREVKLEGETENKSANTIGAGVGAIAGQAISSDKAVRVVGALLGGFAGYHIATALTSMNSERKGIEVVVAVEDKKPSNNRRNAKTEEKPKEKLITVTQEFNPNEVFAKGETVFLSTDKKGVTRISKSS